MMRWTLLSLGLCVVMGCSLYHETVKTVHDWGQVARASEGYVKTASTDKAEWHTILVEAWKEFWPLIVALLGGTGIGAWKLYKHEPSKHRRFHE